MEPGHEDREYFAGPRATVAHKPSLNGARS